jgi:hypothetical protein
MGLGFGTAAGATDIAGQKSRSPGMAGRASALADRPSGSDAPVPDREARNRRNRKSGLLLGLVHRF